MPYSSRRAMRDDPALTWLRAVVATFLGERGTVRIAPPLSLDVETLVARALDEGVAGLAASVAAKGEYERKWPELSARLRFESMQRMAHNMSHLAALSELDTVLGEAGLPAMVIKGGALIPLVYDGSARVRPLGDVDLVVRPEHRDELLEVLRALDFRRSPASTSSYLRDAVAIDVHVGLHDLVSVKGLRGPFSPYRIDEPAIWGRARLLPGRQHLLAPSDLDHFVLVALHGLKHAFSRLIWLVDLVLLFRRVDTHLLWQEVRRARLENAVAASLMVTERTLGIDLGGTAMVPRWGGVPIIGPAVARRVADRRAGAELGAILVATCMPHTGDRLRFLAAHVLPSLETLEVSYPGISPMLRPAWRFWRLASYPLRKLRRPE